jgi:hypothetical protein
MKKNNVLFITLTGASVVLISAIMADNITFAPPVTAGCTANATMSDAQDTRNTETVRQKFKNLGLPLHEGKYWKGSHE